MENWGLITYRQVSKNILNLSRFNSRLSNRETTLLYDEKRSSVFNRERVLEVIAHELAHQVSK